MTPTPLAPGRIATIYGQHLGPAQPCQGAADPVARETPNPLRPHQAAIETQVFPTRLCDTEVHVGGVPAGLLYVAAGQINFRVPQSVPANGDTQLRVLHKGRPGPVVSVPLATDELKRTPEQVAAGMWSALKRVSWGRPYNPRAAGCTHVPAQPTMPRGGLNSHAYYCAAAGAGILTESLFYPVNPADPEVLLLRADIRPDETYPEQSAEVEQHLVKRLTREFGAGTTLDNFYEIGMYRFRPGLSWRAGELTLFLHSNSSHLQPVGLRAGVQLIAMRDEILAQRSPMEPALPPFPYAAELERLFPRRYFAAKPRQQQSEQDRAAAARQTRTALLGFLRQPGDQPDERAAALLAADDLAKRLGELLVIRTVEGGSEHLARAADADTIFAQLAKLGVRYGDEIGHYSSVFEYDQSLLGRAWREHPGTIWGQRAFLMLQKQGCGSLQFRCPGSRCFLAVIEQGKKFLERYPESPLRTAQIHHLGQAYETWWSLGQAKPGDISADGARVTRAAAESARLQAIEWYQELLRAAPGTPEARAAEIALPRLKLKLDTGQRTFFCFSC